MMSFSRFFLSLTTAAFYLFIGVPSLHADEEISLKKDGIDFIVQNMPASDKDKIPLSRIEKEIEIALSVRDQFPWASRVPWAIYRNDVLPYAVTDESRDSWKEDMLEIFAPLVGNCETAREATLAIAANIGKASGVKYSIKRKKPNQSPKESIESGMASCTGQSILLVSALRAVGIPARLAGVLLWSHIRGNHTWVEAWCEGKWEMIEFNEKNFNTPWVMENIGMLDMSKEEHKIIATTWEGGDRPYPLVWNFKPQGGEKLESSENSFVRGVDVSNRYMQLAKQWYQSNGTPEDGQRLYIDFVQKQKSGEASRKPVAVSLVDESGRELEKGITPSTEKDVRQFLKFFLPQGTTCSLEWRNPNGAIQSRKVVASNDTPVQIVNLEYAGE